MTNIKELKTIIHKSAYDTAQDEVCNSGCECYSRGVCPCKPGEKTKCYYFKHTFEYHYFEEVSKVCRKEKDIKFCTDCDLWNCCPHGFYDGN